MRFYTLLIHLSFIIGGEVVRVVDSYENEENFLKEKLRRTKRQEIDQRLTRLQINNNYFSINEDDIKT